MPNIQTRANGNFHTIPKCANVPDLIRWSLPPEEADTAGEGAALVVAKGEEVGRVDVIVDVGVAV